MRDSRAIFDRMLRGQATSAEYTAAVKRETRELLKRRGWAPRVPPPPDPQTVEAFRTLEVERNRYREALERIAETPFSPEPGWRHWRLTAALALREGAAPSDIATASAAAASGEKGQPR